MDRMIATISAQEATPKPSTLQGFFSSFPFFSGQQFGNVNDRWFCTSNNNQVTEIETSSSDEDDEDEEEDAVLDSFLPPSFFAPAENEHDVVDETAAVLGSKYPSLVKLGIPLDASPHSRKEQSTILFELIDLLSSHDDGSNGVALAKTGRNTEQVVFALTLVL